jgi:hypothetical protein
MHNPIAPLVFVSLFLIALGCFSVWLGRCHLYGGWRQSSRCLRCGHIAHGSPKFLRGPDKTCIRCGPQAEFENVAAKPVGLWGYSVRSYGQETNDG